MKRADVRVAVVLMEGTNCELESCRYFQVLGANAEMVHLKQLTGDAPEELKRDIMDYHIVMLPGGFSAGDYVRAGAIMAARMKSRLAMQLANFVNEGRALFGVCNGFQVLVELGMLPGIAGTLTTEPEAALATNDSARYECRPTLLKHENAGSCAFTTKVKKGQVLLVPSAHMEGKFLLPKDREKFMLKELRDNDQIVFRYVDDQGKYAGYPWNPNGSLYNIAALCNREGNVLGIQPHPERSFFRYLHPDWTRSSHEGPGDGQAIFESVLDYVTARF
jgi:phosphoribosylformylglycinamidine synthase I